MGSNGSPSLNERLALSNADFNALYEAGEEKVLAQGEKLIQEGDTDDTVYLILEGELEIRKSLEGVLRVVGQLGPGRWVGEIAYIREIPRTSEVAAKKPAVVLALTRETIESLQPELRLTLLRQFADLADERLYSLIKQEEEIISQRHDRMSYIKTLQDTEKATYSRSHLIKEVIEKAHRLPVYAVQVISMLYDPNTESKTSVVERIKKDHAVSVQVLKYVNSPLFGFQQKITDLQQAIVLLGFSQVYQLLLFNALRPAMPDSVETKKTLAHSMMVAYVASELAVKTNPGRESWAITHGIFHDLGPGMVRLLKATFPKMNVVFDTLDPAILGCMLLEHWELPAEVSESACYEHYLSFDESFEMPLQFRHNAALLSLSHLIIDSMGDRQDGEPIPVLVKDYMEKFLHEKTLAGVIEHHLLPALNKKKKALPGVMREFVSGDPKAFTLEGEAKHLFQFGPEERLLSRFRSS